MQYNKLLKILFPLMVFFVFACEDGDEVVDVPEIPNDTSSVSKDTTNVKPNPQKQKDYTVHKFVYDIFGIYYYWNEYMPKRINLADFDTPYDVLESFRYVDDRFSAVVNSYEDVEKQFQNEFLSDGLNSEWLYEDQDKQRVIGRVLYVYDDSPAKQAGMKRGDIITKVDGITLTPDNYSDLLSRNSCTYTYKKTSDIIKTEEMNFSNAPEYESEAIVKIDMKVDPVLQVKVFPQDNGKRIGYFLYDGFTQDTKTIMNAVEKLEAEQVTDLVLDLRLNGGGYISTLDTLVSMLVPQGNAGNVFIKTEYNKIITEDFKRQGSIDFDKEFFVDISPKLELSTLYVLVSNHTASASEELISGLSPYMNVVLIGDKATVGKFTTNVLFHDENDGNGTDDDGIPYSSWGAYVSIACCKNSNNEMKFANGFTPDYIIAEEYAELGEVTEPFFAKAISLINGGELAKSAKVKKDLFGEQFATFGKPEILRAACIQKNFK